MTYIQKMYFLNFNVNGFLDLSTLVLNAGVCFFLKKWQLSNNNQSLLTVLLPKQELDCVYSFLPT